MSRRGGDGGRVRHAGGSSTSVMRAIEVVVVVVVGVVGVIVVVVVVGPSPVG